MVKNMNVVFNLLYRPGRNKTTSQPVDVLGAERLRVECRRLSSVAVVGDRRDVERRGLQLRLCQRRQRLDLRQSRRDRENQLFLNSSERQFGWRISDQRRTFRRFKLWKQQPRKSTDRKEKWWNDWDQCDFGKRRKSRHFDQKVAKHELRFCKVGWY